MEETDSTPWTGGGETLPEVLSPPAWAAQLHSSAATCLLCPHWNRGSVSPCRPVESDWPRKVHFTPEFLFPLCAALHSYSRKWEEVEVCQELSLEWNETPEVSILCQTGGSAGPSCGALLRGGGGEERHGRGGHLQGFRNHQWHQRAQGYVQHQ